MKIYNEIVLQWNDKLNKFDTISEDSFNYNGPLDLAQEYEIEENLEQEIESFTDTALGDTGTEFAPGFDTENLTNRSLAYLGTEVGGLEAWLQNLGIRNPSQYSQFMEKYDPTQESLEHTKFSIGKTAAYKGLQDDLVGKLAPVQQDLEARLSKSGIEGMGQSLYENTLRDVDTRGQTQDYLTQLESLGVGRDEQIMELWKDFSKGSYARAGDIYSQQNQPSGGGGKK